MSCGRKDEYESPGGFGAASTGAGRGTAQSEAVITDGVLAQQEQQAGGQQSRETLSRQSVHAPATGARDSRQARAISNTVKRAEGRRTIGMILHNREPVAGRGRSILHFPCLLAKPLLYSLCIERRRSRCLKSTFT